MQALLERSRAPQLIAEFADEDIAAWPFWKRGDGYRLRGQAHIIVKTGGPASADLTRALEWISDARLRDGIQLQLDQILLKR